MRTLPSILVLAACTSGPAVPPIGLDPEPRPHPTADGVGSSYTLTFPEAAAQYLEVEAVFPATGDELELFMAGWTPGSYRIRDYARHVEALVASTPDGDRLPVRKSAVNRWVIDAADTADVVVRYKVFADGTSVRESRVEADAAVLNGAPTFLTAIDRLDRPHDVRFILPDAWADLATGLPPHPSGEPSRFRAPDFDVLVDSPILAGKLSILEWTLDGTPHRLAHLHAPPDFPGERTAADVEAISRATVAFWGGMPYRDYIYLNVLNGRGGGLEHKTSSLMFAHPDIMHDDDAYKKWLGLASHEFFHTWNVKRLRPEGLGPFNYEQPVLTPNLWVAEGLTSYYADLLLVRAELFTEEEWLSRLSRRIERTQAMKGRKVRSLEQASEDAWIKYYQPDANHDNVSTDYYSKGAVVGFLLDAEIRKKSGGWASLDDAMRLAYKRYSGERGYTAAAFQEVCEEVAGSPLEDFFERFVRGTAELDYAPALELYGLRFAHSEPNDPEIGQIGIQVSGGQITRITRGSPAWGADVIVGDELIAIDGHRLKGSVRDLLRGKPPGQQVELLLSRRDRLRKVRLGLAAPTDQSFTLEPRPDASLEARTHRTRLLGQPRPGSPESRAAARAKSSE
ncbi:MAG: M61 family peptidase [Deltaproteobacteria bacterium]|nr:MAG: M61 family peptidase [Deltaproteobacteria bacterium]